MDNIVVGVRVRPLNEREKCAPDYSHAWRVSPTRVERTEVTGASREPLSFNFDSVFEPGATNEDVYNAIAAPVVESALGGFNGTVFAYGQTSSGKTYTMIGTESDLGVTQRAIEHVLRVANASKTRQYLVRASYVEIYNDKINDLQKPDRTDLNIREDKAGRVFVEAEEGVVETLDDAMAILQKGQEGRKVGSTNMNAHSSRSHTVFSLLIESKDDVGMDKTFRASTLNLVDLAGSERLKSTGAKGQRAKEGAHINKSLLTLGTIINKLSKSGNDPAKLGHLPYRESKLTRLLRPALGGNSKTAVLCAITPSGLHVDETVSTLKFAERAKKITNRASRNEVTDFRAKYKAQSIELAVLQERFAALEAAHTALQKSNLGSAGSISPASSVTDMATSTDTPTSPREEPDVGSSSVGASIGEVVGLRMDLETAKEEIEYLKGHVDEVETENEHLRAQMKKKNNEYRDLRNRTLELRQAARAARQKERDTCRALIVAYAKLEEARGQLEQSRKKGAHVKVAENHLSELSASLRSWLPVSSGGTGIGAASAGSTVASPTSSSSSLAVVSGSDGRAQLAREIGRDSEAGRQLMRQIAMVASPNATPMGSLSGASARFLPGTPSTPHRRPRPLPEDLVMDIDDDESERNERLLLRLRGKSSARSCLDRVEGGAAAEEVAIETGAAALRVGGPRSQIPLAMGHRRVTSANEHGLRDIALWRGRADSEGGGGPVAADMRPVKDASPPEAKEKPKGWRAFKQFYGYGYTRGSVYDEIVGGHRVPSSSKHVSA